MNTNNQSTNALQVFNFEGTIDVQVVIINGDPYFVAADVCHALLLQNPTDRLKTTLEQDEYLTYLVHRSGQQRTVNVVNESGLYALIFQSRKPVAKKFRKWVTSEVLPAIRKTGNYGVLPQQSVTEQDYRDLKMLYDMQKRMSEMFQKQCHYYMDLCNERTDRLIERSDMLVKVITGTM